MFGRVPQSILDDEESQLQTAHENSLDLQSLRHVSENAYKHYLKSRPSPSPESVKRVKNTDLSLMAVHPLLGECGCLCPAVNVRDVLLNVCYVSRRCWTGADGAGPAADGRLHQGLQGKSCMSLLYTDYVSIMQHHMFLSEVIIYSARVVQNQHHFFSSAECLSSKNDKKHPKN